MTNKNRIDYDTFDIVFSPIINDDDVDDDSYLDFEVDYDSVSDYILRYREDEDTTYAIYLTEDDGLFYWEALLYNQKNLNPDALFVWCIDAVDELSAVSKTLELADELTDLDHLPEALLELIALAVPGALNLETDEDLDADDNHE